MAPIFRPAAKAACVAASALLLSAAAAPAPAIALSPHVQDLIEDALSPLLVYPDTARWRFDTTKHYVETQVVICGVVDYQNAMRQYVGPHRFFVIMDGEKFLQKELLDPTEDATGQATKKLAFFCDTL